MSRSCWTAVLAFPGLLLGLVRPARAASFTWDAPVGCPESDAIRWRIEEALGTPLEHAAPLSFNAKVERYSAVRWGVKLDVTPISDESSSASTIPKLHEADAAPATQARTIEASNCEDLAQATGVAIALALGADLADKPAKSAATTDPAQTASKPTEHLTTTTDAPRTLRDTKTKNEKSNPRSLWLGGALGPVLDSGTLPGWALGVEGNALFGMGVFAARIGATILPSKTSAVSGDAGGTFALYAAAVALCGGVERSATRLRLCVGTEVGSLSGRGAHVSYERQGSSIWVAPRADVNISWPLGDPSLRIFAGAGAVLPLVRKDFVVEGLGPVHQPSTISGRLGLGIELLWP